MTKPIYLDHAAATPMDPAVVQAMLPYLTDNFYNPSAIYLSAKAVRKDVEHARAQVAAYLGARPVEVTFTAGGTESDNLAIHGVMRQFPGANCVVSAIEHEAVLAPASMYQRHVAPVRPDGIVDTTALIGLIDDTTVLISVMYANNELGTIQPIRDIVSQLEMIRKQRRTQGNELPLYLHVDACQAANYLDLHVAKLGVDLMTINGSKIYGPKQVGALYVRAGVALSPMIGGGGQERNLRSGTENVAGIIGFSEALKRAQDTRSREVARLQKLQQLFFELLESEVSGAVINGSRKHRLPNNVHITLPGTDNERVMMQLDEQGIQVAVGSACSASNEEPSHVLKAIGLSDDEARASLRITMGRSTDESALRTVVAALAGI